MQLSNSSDSRYKAEFVTAMNTCLSISKRTDHLPFPTGVTGFDSLAGGLPVGDVTVLVGHAGTGKSSILRSMAFGASIHTLLLPLQDGSSLLATQRLLATAAGVDSQIFRHPMCTRDKVLVLDAIEELEAKPISVHAIDNMTGSLLYDIMVEEFGEKDDSPGELTGPGIAIIDNIDMIEACHSWHSRRAALQMLKSLVFGSKVALLVVDDHRSDKDGTDDLANAGLVISAEATAEPFVTKLTVLKGSSGELGRTTLIEFDPKSMAIKTAEQANSR